MGQRLSVNATVVGSIPTERNTLSSFPRHSIHIVDFKVSGGWSVLILCLPYLLCEVIYNYLVTYIANTDFNKVTYYFILALSYLNIIKTYYDFFGTDNIYYIPTYVILKVHFFVVIRTVLFFFRREEASAFKPSLVITYGHMYSSTASTSFFDFKIFNAVKIHGMYFFSIGFIKKLN